MNAMMTIEAGKPAMSLDIPKEQTFDEWEAMGRSLCEGQRVVNWWIGDWWAFGSGIDPATGRPRYGERARTAAEGIWGKEFQTLVNLGSVSRSFEPNRRRLLSWTHHAEVAALPIDEAESLLDRAEAEGLPKNKLRTLARLRKIDLGIIRPADVGDDDDATKAAKKVQYIWNASTEEVREYIFEAIKEAAENGYEDLDV